MMYKEKVEMWLGWGLIFYLCVSVLLVMAGTAEGAQPTARGYTDNAVKKLLEDGIDTGKFSAVEYANGKVQIIPAFTNHVQTISSPSFFLGGRGGQMIKHPVTGEIYVHERSRLGGSSNQMAKLNTSFQWTQLDSSPFNMTDQGAVGISQNGDTIVYMDFNSNRASNYIFTYSVPNDVWNGMELPAELAFLYDSGSTSNGGMNGAMPLISDNKLLYCGGWETTGNGDKCITFDVTNDSMVQVATMPDSSDLGALSPVVSDNTDTFIFFAVGERNAGSTTRDMWRYDVVNDTWVDMGEMPTPMTGEGGHWVPQVINQGQIDEAVVYKQGSPSSEGGQTVIYYWKDDRFVMLTNRSSTMMNMNQVSSVFLDADKFDNLTIFRTIFSTNSSNWEAYKIVYSTVYTSE